MQSKEEANVKESLKATATAAASAESPGTSRESAQKKGKGKGETGKGKAKGAKEGTKFKKCNPFRHSYNKH